MGCYPAPSPVTNVLESFDLAVLEHVDVLRTCGRGVLIDALNHAVRPLGLALVAAAFVRNRLRRPSPPLRDALEVVVASIAGVLLVEALKDVIDRPRPWAEFLSRAGDSFPSGHVGNVVVAGAAFLVLWSGRPGRRPGAVGLAILAAVVALVAFARVYCGKHWPTDVVGTALLFGVYAALAFWQPSARRRMGTAGAVLVVSLALIAAAASGYRLHLPPGDRVLATAPVLRVAFGAARRDGRLQGRWTGDAPNPRRDVAWLHGSEGALDLGRVSAPVDEIRIVLRQDRRGESAGCRRLYVALDGKPLGSQLLELGWRAYPFPVARDAFDDRDAVLSLRVENLRPDGRGPSAPTAAFGEVTLHGRP
jgi:membrane-associated phospholipid phosphatase